MAITTSGLYVASFVSALSGGITLNLTLTTHKVAMYTNAITPNFDTDTAYSSAPYTTNEVTGTGYTAGGALLPTPTLADSAGGYMVFSAANVSWSTSTITNARAALIYADALAGKNCIALINFGADYSTTAGTFTIQWNAGGISSTKLTP